MKFLKKDFIFQDVNKLKGVGPQLSKFLKNKKIEKVKDIILNLHIQKPTDQKFLD